MRRTVTGTVAILALLLAQPAAAQFLSPGGTIPVVANLPGVAGTYWRSDVTIANVSDTDTTVGLLSQEAGRLHRAKNRSGRRPYLTALPSLRELKGRARTPREYRNRVRRSRKTTFIFPNRRSFRVVRDPRHLLLLRRLGWAFSTSANPSGAPFDETWARSVADLVVEPLGRPGAPSRILKLGRARIRKIR